jgi:hypothetical protein
MMMKNKPIFMLLILAIGAVFLSACDGGGNEVSNEDVVNQAYTQAAQTLQAGIAQTQASQPTATFTPFVLNSPTPPLLATNTLPPSPTVLFPTLAPLSTPTPTTYTAYQPSEWIGGRPCLRAEIAWENFPDGSRFFVDEGFIKEWRLTNSGYCTWTEKFSAIWVGGPNLAGQGIYYFKDLKDFPSEGIPNGSTLILRITMQAPSQRGHYKSLWKLRDDKATYFGVGGLGDEVFWVEIVVREP